MVDGFLVLVEVGIDGADVEMGATGRYPIIDFEDLQLQALLEVGQRDLGLLGSKSNAFYFL